MSTRALRRMQTANATSKEIEDEAEIEENEEPVQSGIGNKFDFLAEDEDNGENEGEEEEVDDEATEQVTQTTSCKSSKKKKKKKKGPKQKAAASPNVDDDDLFLEQAIKLAAAASANSSDYFDGKVLQNVEPKQTESLCSKFGLAVKDAMSLNPRYLNSAHEVRFRFGTQVGGAPNAQRGQRRGQRRMLLQSRLITPRPNWPLLGRTGLSMRPVEDASASGSQNFTYEHDNAYAEVQQEFWAAVETMSPDAIAAVHRNHPYHIDTLLQLAELCLTADDPQSAADLVERAIFAMETSVHHNFNLTRLGSRTLDFRRFENRSFYLALFRHVLLLGRKGCTRTAFELSKLLLSLDFRRDPMCALLLIDFYALRTGCNAELIAIYDDLWRSKSLDWLPNWAYSLPLACFRLASTQNASGLPTMSKPHMPTASSDRILATARSLMFSALSRFPSVLVPLLEACSVKPDGQLATCKWFPSSLTEATDEPKAQRALEALYVDRCSTVWKDMETLSWLESVVAEFVESLPDEEAQRRLSRDRAKLAFQQQCSRNVLRHLVLAGHREPLGFVSTELPFTAAIFSYDPLPPNDAIWSYTRTNPRRGRGANSESSPLDFFATFFTSLLPNYNPAEQNQLRVRFDNVIEAFRGVLAGLHLEPPPFEAANQQQQQGQQERFDLADLTDSEDEAEDPRRADNDELE